MFSKNYLKIEFLIFFIFLITLFCSLGVWQLHRYHYKKDLLATFQQQQKNPEFLTANTTISQFKHIQIAGQYRNDMTMLLQNQFYHDRVGFEVLTPAQIPGEKKLLLVDRGWISKENTKTILASTSSQKISGYVKLLNENVFILGKNILDPKTSPIVMQKIDLAEISQITHQEFYPFILRLDPNQPNGFIRDWIIVSVPPARHLAYAVQWFLFALIASGIIFWLGVRRVD